MNFKEMVEEYVELREGRRALTREIDEISTQMRELENKIISAQEECGLKSVKTDKYTAFQTEKRYYRVDDPAVLRDKILELQLPEILQMRVSKGVVEDLISEGQVIPEEIGLSLVIDTRLNVRKS